MHRFTKFLFALSDIFAWLLLAFSSMAVVAYPIAGSVYAKMSHQSLTTFDIIGICAILLIVAAGAFAITRRKVLGIALVLAPAVANALSGQFLFALGYTGAVAVVFATPFLLVFLQVRSAVASDQQSNNSFNRTR
jgi:hypothetical protein